jgi:hypothetical protein
MPCTILSLYFPISLETQVINDCVLFKINHLDILLTIIINSIMYRSNDLLIQ